MTILTSVWSLVLDLLDWMTKNTATVSVIAIVLGLAIQFFSSRRNKAKLDADERRAQEEHELQMEIMRRELAEHSGIAGKGIQDGQQAQ